MQVAGFVIRDESPIASNWRSEGTLRDYLTRHGIVAISDIDTRALTRVLRSAGRHARRHRHRPASMPDDLVDKARAIPKMEGADLVHGRDLRRRRSTSSRRPADDGFVVDAGAPAPKRPLRVAAYDYGMKWNILRRFAAHGCDVRVYPATTPASELLATTPDGVFLSNGPGDPAVLDYAIANARNWSRATCRCSASASGTRCSGWRWARARSS